MESWFRYTPPLNSFCSLSPHTLPCISHFLDPFLFATGLFSYFPFNFFHSLSFPSLFLLSIFIPLLLPVFCSLSMCFWVSCIIKTMLYLSLCIFFISVMMISKCIYLLMNASSSPSLWLEVLHSVSHRLFFIHLSVDMYIGHFQDFSYEPCCWEHGNACITVQ